jgi:hypothetical protein
LTSTGNDYLVADGSVNALKYDCKDSLGRLSKLSAIKKVTRVLLTPGSSQEEDVTSSAKLEGGGSQVIVTFENIQIMKWTSYALRFELENAQTKG